MASEGGAPGTAPRRHDLGVRPSGVVHVPGEPREHGSVGETEVAGLRGRRLLLGEHGGGNGGDCSHAGNEEAVFHIGPFCEIFASTV